VTVLISIQTPPEHTDYAQLRDVWLAADELGFHAAFTFDHLVPLRPGARPGHEGPVPAGTQLDGWITVAALAAVTRRLQVGTLVTGVTYRHPAVLAKMAVTLDHVSGGRAILGIGAAWHESEHRMFGIEFPSVGERMTRLDETLAAFRLLCATAGPVDFAGSTMRLAGAVFEPKPVRPDHRLPVLVGGSGRRLMGIAARHADLYNGFWAPWEWADVNARLDRMIEAADRSAGEVQRAAYVFSELSGRADATAELVARFQQTRGGSDEEVRARIVAGAPEAMLAVLRSYRDAGVSHVVVNLRPPFDAEALARFAQTVLPVVDD
jgi:alkanesulfonate monooxygenase SsuD/methylene tetrahydromethanopterin reductase-like flavin-dependent oxidoreductase (luciferase family)